MKKRKEDLPKGAEDVEELIVQGQLGGGAVTEGFLLADISRKKKYY